MTQAVATIPVRLTLYVGENYETVYPLVGGDFTFTSVGVNSAVCALAVGYGPNGQTGPSLRFTKGTPAKVVVESEPVKTGTINAELPPSNFEIFTGEIEIGGPAVMSFGSFAATVRISGRLNRLVNGTLQTANLIPSSYLDTAVQLKPVNREQFFTLMKAEDVDADYGQALIDVLKQTISSGVGTTNVVLQQVLDIFGEELNTKALEVLDDIIPKLTIREALNTDNLASSFIMSDLTNTALTNDYRLESFYHKISVLGELFRFRLLEVPGYIYLAPYTPLVPSDKCYEMDPGSYSVIQWSDQGVSRHRGVVLLGQSADGPPEPIISGIYERPNTPSGMILQQPAPEVLRLSKNAVFSAVNLPEIDLENTSVSGSDDLRDQFGNAMARMLLLERVYSARSIQIQCPFFRTDIGPLTALKIKYPDIVSDSLGSEVYGSVQQVRITINAASRSASTTFDVGFVRSYTEQVDEVDDPDWADIVHPIWNQWIYRTFLDRDIG